MWIKVIDKGHEQENEVQGVRCDCVASWIALVCGILEA